MTLFLWEIPCLNSPVKDTLQSNFGIKDLGILKFFLGLEAAHSTKVSLFARDSIVWICSLTAAPLAQSQWPLLLNQASIYTVTLALFTKMFMHIAGSLAVCSILIQLAQTYSLLLSSLANSLISLPLLITKLPNVFSSTSKVVRAKASSSHAVLLYNSWALVMQIGLVALTLAVP